MIRMDAIFFLIMGITFDLSSLGAYHVPRVACFLGDFEFN